MLKSFVNGGQGAIVVVTFMMTSLSQGVIRSVGVFGKELRLDIGLTTSGLGVATGLSIGLMYFLAPTVSIAYRLLDKPRHIALTGAVCTTFGTILSSFSCGPVIFCLCFALLGLGNSLVFLSSIITLKEVAEDRFDLLYGISTSGYSFGTIFVPIAAEYLQMIYGWRGSMLILGGVTANIIPFIVAIGPAFNAVAAKKARDKNAETGGESHCISRKSRVRSESSLELLQDESRYILNERTQTSKTQGSPKLSFDGEITALNYHNSKNSSPNEQATKLLNEEQSYSSGKTPQKNANRHNNDSICWAFFRRVHLDNFQSLKQPCLMILSTAYFVIGIEVAGWRAIFVPRALHKGLPYTHVNYLDLTASFANFISRLTLGLVMRKSGNTSTVFLCLVVLEGLSKLLDVFLLQFPVMIVCSFFSGIALEAMAFLPVILGAELLLEPTNFDILFGLLELSYGAGMLAGGAIVGLIAEKMGFDTAYLALAIVNGVTFLLAIVFKYCEKRSKQTSHSERGL